MFNEKNITLVYKLNMENNNPLSPHLQIYKWQISSLLSITHRIVGVVNFFAIILICFWTMLIIFGQSNYSTINMILNSGFGKVIRASKTDWVQDSINAGKLDTEEKIQNEKRAVQYEAENLKEFVKLTNFLLMKLQFSHPDLLYNLFLIYFLIYQNHELYFPNL